MALAEFRCAYSLDPSPEALAQVALAEMALGRWVDAGADLERAMSHDDDRWVRAHHAPLTAAAESISDNIGELTIEGIPAGADVVLDGRVVGQLPLRGAVRLPTGWVEIELRASGFGTVRRERRIEARASAHETIELVPLGDGVGTEKQTAKSAPGPGQVTTSASVAVPGQVGGLRPAIAPPMPAVVSRPLPDVSIMATAGNSGGGVAWPAWVTLGGGLVSLGTAIGFHVWREKLANDFNGHCNIALQADGGGDCSSLHHSINLAETVYIIGYVTAAVLGGSSTYLFVTAPRPSSGGTQGAFACTPEPDRYGLVCTGNF